MATHKKVLGNMFSQAGGRFLGALASLVVVKIVTNMGVEFYGNYVTAYEFLAFFGIIADAGLFSIAVRDMSKKPEDTKRIAANMFSLRLIFVIAVTLLAGISAQFVPSYPLEVKLGIWITGLSMALTIVAGSLSSVLQARMKIHYFSGAMVVGKIFLAIFIFFISRYAMLFDNLFFTMLWAGVWSNIIFCLIVMYYVHKEVPIRLGFDIPWWKKTLRHSLPYGLALILQTLYLRINLVLISILLGTTAAGIYGAATRVLEGFLVLGVFFGQSILPKLSAEEEDHHSFEKTISWGMEMLLLFSLPLIIMTSKYSTLIIKFLASPEFLTRPGFWGADTIIFILVFTVFFAYFNQLFSYSLLAKNKQKYLLFVNGVALVMNAGLNIFLLPRYGIVASAIATVFCEALVFTLLLRKTMGHSKLHFSLKNMSIIGLANGVLILEIYLTPLSEMLTMGAAVGSLSYLIILFFFRKNFLRQES